MKEDHLLAAFAARLVSVGPGGLIRYLGFATVAGGAAAAGQLLQAGCGQGGAAQTLQVTTQSSWAPNAQARGRSDQIRSHSQRRQCRARRARGLLPRPQRVARQHRDLVDLRRGSVQHVPAQHAWGREAGGVGGCSSGECSSGAQRRAGRCQRAGRRGCPRARWRSIWTAPVPLRWQGRPQGRRAGTARFPARFPWQEKRVPIDDRVTHRSHRCSATPRWRRPRALQGHCAEPSGGHGARWRGRGARPLPVRSIQGAACAWLLACVLLDATGNRIWAAAGRSGGWSTASERCSVRSAATQREARRAWLEVPPGEVRGACPGHTAIQRRRVMQLRIPNLG